MTSDRKRLLLRIVSSLLILLVFALAAQRLVGWRSLLHPWLYLHDPTRLVWAALLVVSTYLLRALRIYRYFGLSSGFGPCLRLFLQYNLLVTFLPLRTGELAFPALMKRYYGVSASRSLPSLLWLRAMDLHVLIGGALVLIAWKNVRLASLVLLWVGLVPLAVVFSQWALVRTSRRGSRIWLMLSSVLGAVPNSPRALVENWLLTLANWALKIAVLAWIILQFTATSYRSSLAGVIGGEMSVVLPIQGIAGFGTFEAGVVGGMRTLGITVSNALTGAANLHLFGLGVLISATMLSLLVLPTSRRREGECAPRSHHFVAVRKTVSPHRIIRRQVLGVRGHERPARPCTAPMFALRRLLARSAQGSNRGDCNAKE